MKLNKINLKTLKPLRNLVAYKWLKVDKLVESACIIIPNSINEGGGEGRMGNKYTCEVLAIGADVNILKIGDRFLMHEYNKIETAVPWNVNDIMFIEEYNIIGILKDKVENFMVPAEKITNKLMNEYEEY